MATFFWRSKRKYARASARKTASPKEIRPHGKRQLPRRTRVTFAWFLSESLVFAVDRRVPFFRFAERKEPKKGRPHCLRPLRFATGQPGVLVHGVHRRTRCAPAALRSNNCGESAHEVRVSFGTRATPRPARPRRIQKGTRGTSTRAIASLRCARPQLAGASATRCAGQAERSDGPNGCPAVWMFGSPPLLAAPAAGRLWGEHGRRSAHAS